MLFSFLCPNDSTKTPYSTLLAQECQGKILKTWHKKQKYFVVQFDKISNQFIQVPFKVWFKQRVLKTLQYKQFKICPSVEYHKSRKFFQQYLYTYYLPFSCLNDVTRCVDHPALFVDIASFRVTGMFLRDPKLNKLYP